MADAPSSPPAEFDDSTEDTSTMQSPTTDETETNKDEDDEEAQKAKQLAALEPPPPPPSDPVEDAAQDLIRLGSLPTAVRNTLSGASLEILLRMIGHGDDEGAAPLEMSRSMLTNPMANSGFASSTSSNTHGAPHPSRTLVTLLKRLNEEFRARSLTMRDEYEDKMNQRREDHEENLNSLRKDQLEKLERKRQKAEEERKAETEREKLEQNSTAAAEAEYAAEIHKLEQRLFATSGNAETGDTANASARRLLTFWKTKYQSLCSDLENHEEEVTSLKIKLSTYERLQDESPEALKKVMAHYRERETKERHRTEALRDMYFHECDIRGVKPKEPKLVIHLSDAASAIAPSNPDGQSVAESFAGSQIGPGSTIAGSRASPGSIGNLSPLLGAGVDNQSDTTTPRTFVPASVYYFTDIGRQDPQIEATMSRITSKHEEATDLLAAIDDAEEKLGVLQQQYEDEQLKYAQVVGTLSAHTAQFFEEIIELRAQVDAHEQRCYELAVNSAAEESRHATQLAILTEKLEDHECKNRLALEEQRRSLREKDMDLLRASNRADRGHRVSIMDFSDAPRTDLGVRLEALQSQLAVLDAERHLLKQEVTRVESAAVELDEEAENATTRRNRQ